MASFNLIFAITVLLVSSLVLAQYEDDGYYYPYEEPAPDAIVEEQEVASIVRPASNNKYDCSINRLVSWNLVSVQ